MEWLNNLSKAIEYIENHLDQEISFDEVARIACCSTYYFQRIFSYVAGISLAEYIRRRRMTQAAFELQGTDKRVLDIALKYGYASPTSFNRAFQSVHGISPIAAKEKGALLNAYPPIRFSVKVSGGSAMSYHIIEKPAFRIVGITATFYKKGTCHIEFTNTDVLKSFNLFASQKKGWLPPTYGKKAYKDMSDIDKQVIDSYEGEASYTDTLARHLIPTTTQFLQLHA